MNQSLTTFWQTFKLGEAMTKISEHAILNNKFYSYIYDKNNTMGEKLCVFPASVYVIRLTLLL